MRAHEHADGRAEARRPRARRRTAEGAAAHEHATDGAGVDANGTAHGEAGHDHEHDVAPGVESRSSRSTSAA